MHGGIVAWSGFFAAKTAPAISNTASNLTVKGELRVKSSVFRNNGYVINVGN